MLFFVFLVGSSSASGAVNLSIEKHVTGGPYHAGDMVFWGVSIYNSGPEDGKNITVLDEIDENGSFQSWTGDGVFDTTNGKWFIGTLENQRYANLTIGVRYSTEGTHCNRVNITLINDTAPQNEYSDLSDHNDTACIDIGRTVSASLLIKPERLNLKSGGVFTGFIEIDGIVNAAEIDLDATEIVCGEAILRKLILAWPEDEHDDGHRIIAKFERTDLNITDGDAVQINCTGFLSVNGDRVKIEGNDTIRVIRERPPASFMNRILAVFGLSRVKEDREQASERSGASALINPEQANNPKQQQKSVMESERLNDADGEESSRLGAAETEKGQNSRRRGGQNEKAGEKRLEKRGRGFAPENQATSGES